MFKMRIQCKNFVYFLLISCLSLICNASIGDELPSFLRCAYSCSDACTDVETAQLPSSLRYLYWTCEDNCKYECMHEITKSRTDNGFPVVQFYGKWPFTRWAGTQEPASVFFSLLNLGSNIYGLCWYWKRVPKKYPLRRFWILHGFLSINVWVWSTVFHARDVHWTERMDYFSVFLSFLVGVAVVLIRLNSSWDRTVPKTLLFSFVAVVFSVYMNWFWVQMDYGLNMKLAIGVSLLYFSLWSCIALRERHLYFRRLLLMFSCVGSLMSLELGDFPPLWNVLDAHAMWHGGTIPLPLIWYRFLLDDALCQVKKMQNQPSSGVPPITEKRVRKS